MARSLLSVGKRPFPAPPPGPLLPQDKPVDEEICPGYSPKTFYPAKPGEVLAKRYQILVKVGWGSSSTVWLARDIRGHVTSIDKMCSFLIVYIGTDGNPKVSWH